MIIFLGIMHLVIGFVFSYGVVWLNWKLALLVVGLLDIIIFISMIEVGSIFPDVDKDNSIIGREIEEVSSVINAVLGHRGIFHNVYFYSVICGMLLFLIDGKYGMIGLLGFYFGVILHIVGDKIEDWMKWELEKINGTDKINKAKVYK